MQTETAIVRADGEGERLRFLGGGLITLKATEAETDGAFLLFEDRMFEGKATPLHTHATDDDRTRPVAGRHD